MPPKYSISTSLVYSFFRRTAYNGQNKANLFRVPEYIE